MDSIINVGVIGLGGRGHGLMCGVLFKLSGIRITAVCDIYEDRVKRSAEAVQSEQGHMPFMTTRAEEVLSRADVDAVLISTSWRDHISLSIDAMKAGKAVACEVGGAYSIQDCYDLVSTYEKTRTPIMLMENCCFCRQELLATAMARAGVFGKIVHCSGAYAHDLRDEIAYGEINRHYRLGEYTARNRENYPTHELGPIARLLNINRGNRMVRLTSMSSLSAGLHTYVQDKEELASLRDVEFAQGDIFHTLIQCENGETILLKLDTTLPRYYSREFTVRGTKGFYSMDGSMVFLDGMKEFWDPTDAIRLYGGNEKDYEAQYLPSLWKDITPEEMESGHGGMDYLEFREFFDALREGREMPIDVYDMASWMVISCLSEESARLGGAPMEIPDFTNGAWRTREPRDVVPL